ncbi:hypothetical protein, partial [Nonomuraea glycinis]|uniref:hypothetical protein n=1 Tax=Nonomuraea glycinis TaxID=2047744 RepID=UPI0033AE9BE2
GPAVTDYSKLLGPAVTDYSKLLGPAVTDYSKLLGPAVTDYSKLAATSRIAELSKTISQLDSTVHASLAPTSAIMQASKTLERVSPVLPKVNPATKILHLKALNDIQATIAKLNRPPLLDFGKLMRDHPRF